MFRGLIPRDKMSVDHYQFHLIMQRINYVLEEKVGVKKLNRKWGNFLTLTVLASSILITPASLRANELTHPQLLVQSTSELTEEKIRQTMVAIEEAERSESIEELLKFLAPFAISEVTVESQGSKITTNLEGIEAHRALLESTFELVKDRGIINNYMNVRITPDGQVAVVTRMIVEELTTSDGKEFLVSGTDTFHFAWIDNQPMIVLTKSQGWIEERPSQQ